MQLHQELPDYSYALRAADGSMARVNDRVLLESFVLAPETLIEQWPAHTVAELTPAHLQPLLALNPTLVLLGTGEHQAFPSAAVMATCLTRGIGIEAMTNAAAARTYNVLAGEGRRVVVALLLRGSSGH